MEIARSRGLVPDEMLIARTLTASCVGDGLDSGLRQEVVLNLSRVEIKLTSNEPGESFLFVLHWEKVWIFHPAIVQCFFACVYRFYFSHHSVACALASA